MIQDIGAHRFHNEYVICQPEADSRILCYRNGEALLIKKEDQLDFLHYQQLLEHTLIRGDALIYLFRIDEIRYFLLLESEQILEQKSEVFSNAVWYPISVFRNAALGDTAFAGITGYQLAQWYDQRRFCPRCGQRMIQDQKERMMRCEACNQQEYPKICPAVIVGVRKGDKLLLTRYAGRDYKKYALIAGFAEIGETIEETVQREVLEETGLHVKNIEYYKSQPWSFSSTLLMGFFADADGEEMISLDEKELSEAKWVERDEIPEDDGVSLTREMMRVFKYGKK